MPIGMKKRVKLTNVTMKIGMKTNFGSLVINLLHADLVQLL